MIGTVRRTLSINHKPQRVFQHSSVKEKQLLQAVRLAACFIIVDSDEPRRQVESLMIPARGRLAIRWQAPCEAEVQRSSSRRFWASSRVAMRQRLPSWRGGHAPPEGRLRGGAFGAGGGEAEAPGCFEPPLTSDSPWDTFSDPLESRIPDHPRHSLVGLPGTGKRAPGPSSQRHLGVLIFLSKGVARRLPLGLSSLKSSRLRVLKNRWCVDFLMAPSLGKL